MGKTIAYFVILAILALLGDRAAFAEQVAAKPEPKAESKSGAAELKLEPIKDEPQLAPIDQSVTKAQPTQGDPAKQLRLLGGIEEKDLAIQWDAWHNKVARAVQTGVFSNFIESLNVPVGALCWYHLEVMSDGKIKKAEIIKSSGILYYDKKVLDAVWKLDGKPILLFPVNSKRSEVATNVAVRLGGKRSGTIYFGDVEYSEVNSADKQPK